ncbi:MAG: hypothetical protein GY953_53385 [bacterium]|nr:hypothetical protein [bacterium]
MELPKTVLQRIHRYAEQGRKLKAVYHPGESRLLAVALGEIPMVVLRASNPEQFAEMRSEAFMEWRRTLKKLPAARRSSQRAMGRSDVYGIRGGPLPRVS